MYNEDNHGMTKHDPGVAQEAVKIIKYHGKVRAFMIILFILTLCCMYFAPMSMAWADKLNPQHGFSFVKNTWVFWCWLPIPIASILLGLKYIKVGVKCKKNIIGGFIIAFLLLFYGSFCLSPTFERDYSNVDMYRSFIDAELPDSGQLQIQEWEHYYEEDITEYVEINAYYDKEDVGNLERSIINSSNWIPCDQIRSELKVLIPSILGSDHDAYYSIYNKTTGEYNALPARTGSYEIYAMRYDKSDKQLSIHRFLIEYRT